MKKDNDQINLLLQKLEILLKRQEEFSEEMNRLKSEISKLQAESTEESAGHSPQLKKIDSHTESVKEDIISKYLSSQTRQRFEKQKTQFTADRTRVKSDLEKFIGENLINKIGIVITVIGVAIGAKYAIDKELISPSARIVLGYLFGAGLLGFAIRLKKDYESFSAVLLSGSMAIMYFITYFAYNFYGLIPQVPAFIMMVIFTAFTVAAALRYDRQIIAHLGLVGAYAVPFLLSDGSGKVVVLFTYMAVINAGILIIAFKKYWRKLYYSSFILTWIIYLVWFEFKYEKPEHFFLAFTFLSVFFVLFYTVFLAYKLVRKEKFERNDIVLLLANSFIFYGIGYTLLGDEEAAVHLLGLFTLLNALLHLAVSAVIYYQKLTDRNLVYLVSGLALIFITIAIPVQLDANWVTLLWAGEAALLFWIGRTKAVSFYEKLSYPLMLLAFVSLIHDWSTFYNQYQPGKPDTKITPLLNINFLTSALFVTSFAFINKLNLTKKPATPAGHKTVMPELINFFIPAVFLFSLYFSFRVEIENYWNQLFTDSTFSVKGDNSILYGDRGNTDLINFKTIWVINYSLLFVSLLTSVNIRKIRNQRLEALSLILILIAIAVFLTQGLYVLSELRDNYLKQSLLQNNQTSIFNISIRYFSYVFVALALISFRLHLSRNFLKWNIKIPFDILLHITILWIASSELINWLDMAESTQSYKLGLSILWGTYSLLLISLGIWKKKKYLRIGAIVLFAVTLFKLFFYDISHLDTISKTVVFVLLGILLLIISFLYNKYKHVISNETGI